MSLYDFLKTFSYDEPERHVIIEPHREISSPDVVIEIEMQSAVHCGIRNEFI